MTVARAQRWLIISSCLLLGACSETTVKEAPSAEATQTAATEETINSAQANPATNVDPMVSASTVTEAENSLSSEANESEADNAMSASSVPNETGDSADETDISTSDLSPSEIATTNNQGSTESTQTTAPATANPPVIEVVDSLDSASAEGSEITTSEPVTQADPAVTSDEPEVMTGASEVATSEPEMVTVETEVVAAEPDVVAAEPDVVTAEPQVVTGGPELVTGDPETVTSDQNGFVDCQMQLPCRWSSEDSQLSIIVTNSDNISSRGGLSVQFAVTTVHDTTVSIARSEAAIDSTSTQFDPESQVLGNGNGVTPQGVNAGGTVEGAINFDQPSTDSSISQWAVAIIDGGLIRQASFSNIPIGPITNQIADCENTLPCDWISPNKDVTITLLSAGGLSATNRMSANVTITSAVDTTVALDGGSTAVGNDGTQFTARTHTLANTTGYEKITAFNRAGTPVPAIINFFRTATSPSSLLDLSLIIYNDRPVPRWNPRFTAVPVL